MAYAYANKWTSGSGNTITIAPSAGSLLVLSTFTSSGGGNPTYTIADNLGSTWQVAQAATNDGGGAWDGVQYLLNCGAGITTLTLTFNGGTPGASCFITVVEYTGIAATAAFLGIVRNVQAAPGTGTDALTASGLSVTTAPALLLCLVTSGSASTAGTGFTSRSTTNNLLVSDSRITSTGTYGVTATAANGSATYATHALAFAEFVPSNLDPITACFPIGYYE